MEGSKCGILYLSGGDGAAYSWPGQPVTSSEFIYINQPAGQMIHHQQQQDELHHQQQQDELHHQQQQDELHHQQQQDELHHQLIDFAAADQHQLYQHQIFAAGHAAGFSSSPAAYLTPPTDELSDCSGGYQLLTGTDEDDLRAASAAAAAAAAAATNALSSALSSSLLPGSPRSSTSSLVAANISSGSIRASSEVADAEAFAGGAASGRPAGAETTKVKTPTMVAKRNARERRRVEAVNAAFAQLRKYIPYEKRNKRLSKVKTLRITIEYIRLLEQVLEELDSGVDIAVSANFQSFLRLAQRKEQPVPLTAG